jgi:hypothetical protein
VITDKGTSYSIAFMEDSLDMTRPGGDGIEWKVRKKDLRINRSDVSIAEEHAI